MSRKTIIEKPEYEVTFALKTCYEIKKVVNANNEWEATLEAADYLSGDFDLYWNSDHFDVLSVVRINKEVTE